MTDLSSLATDEDTDRLRTEASKGPSSDPGRDHTALAVAFVAHEQQDARRFGELAKAERERWASAAIVGGILLSIAAWGAQQAWQAHADSSAGRAQIDDMHERIVRIEAQIDRLMDRRGEQ